MPIIDKFQYRAEIDGLRAIAVLAVVLFHADLGCSGGYVGVDIFFVISGFLITSLIWKDLESGGFTFGRFWERRARRIVPAMVVITLATLLAGWFLLMPADFESLGRAAASQAIFAANIYYWRDSSYFAEAADQKPLLHTWSLAVEEQFYLIVPILLWVMFRYLTRRRRTDVIAILALGFIISLALSIYGVVRSPSATFYLLPTRAWELLLGALVAFLPPSPSLLGGRSRREIFALAGLALIFMAIFLYTSGTPFPGLAALPPCLGTALIIWANGRHNTEQTPTAVGAALSIRPVVFIGLISYSFYLWHWPFVAFDKYIALTPLSVQDRVGLLGFGFLCAILSWKYVETPFRTRRLGTSRRSMFGYAGAGLAMVLICGLLCLGLRGFPQRVSVEARGFAGAKTDFAFANNLTAEDVRTGNLVPIGSTDPALHPQVFVWGDSHAMSALPAFDAYLKEKGIAGRAATHSETAPLLDWFRPSEFGLEKQDTFAFNDSVVAYIQREQIPTVILIASWYVYASYDNSGARTINAALLTTVRRLVAIGSQPWILLTVPRHTFKIPMALYRSALLNRDLTPLCSRPTMESEFDTIDPKTIAEIQEAGGRIIDPKPRFLDPTGQYYLIESEGIALYRDEHHLTTKGAKLMLLPFLRDSLPLKE